MLVKFQIRSYLSLLGNIPSSMIKGISSVPMVEASAPEQGSEGGRGVRFE
jgi:hypothetical protein